MSEIREREQEEQRRVEEQRIRQQEERLIQQKIKDAQDKILAQFQEDQDVEDEGDLDLDEESGLKNYFKEIVSNANRNGEKIDLSKY